MQTIRNLAADSTIRQGLLFGLILGGFHIVYSLVNNLMNLQGEPYAWLNRVLLIVLILSLILPGFFTRRTKSGAMAGFTAGLVSAVIGIISLWIVTLLFMDIISQNVYMIMDFQRSGAATINQFIIEDAMGATVIQFFVSLVFGATLGWIGGWLGSISSSQNHSPAL
jgi:hypothetical protein